MKSCICDAVCATTYGRVLDGLCKSCAKEYIMYVDEPPEAAATFERIVAASTSCKACNHASSPVASSFRFRFCPAAVTLVDSSADVSASSSSSTLYANRQSLSHFG